MKELCKQEMVQVAGGDFTAEHGIAGGLSGGLGGAGVAGIYLTLASNPVGWAVAGMIGAGVVVGAVWFLFND